MKAKQILALLLALLMAMSVLVSCGGGDETEAESKQETQGTDNPAVTDPVETEITDDLGDINFKDNENPVITFFLRDGYVWETYVEELTDNVLYDQIYWRNQEVQQRLGIEIAQINQACGWSSSGKYTEWNETLRNAVQTETHDFDAAMIYTGVSSSLGIEGVYMELTQLDKISLEKPWWNQNLMKEATIYGSLYFASGSIAMSQLRDANLMWYNKDMYKEFVAPTAEKDIYQVVRDGEWTIDYMYDMVANIWEDNDSNGEMSSGDTVGFVGGAHGSNGAMDSWLYALGCDLTKIDESIGEPVACFYNEHTVQAFEKARHFFVDNPGAYVVFASGESTGDTDFSNGNAMITLGRFSRGEGMGDYTFSYGILPVPKFDTNQENYRSIPEVTSSMVTIISTVEANRVDMVAATVELLAAEGYKQVKPTYIDVVLKSHSSNSPEDAEMVQLILDSMVYSFGWIFSSTHMGEMGKTFRYISPTADFTNLYETRKEKYESMIELLIDGFASIA